MAGMFDSGIVIFLECVVVFVPLYYSLVATRWINSTSKAINVLSSVRSPKKLTDAKLKKLHIEHGDSVSAVPVAELEKKVKALRHETGDTVLSSRCNSSLTKM